MKVSQERLQKAFDSLFTISSDASTLIGELERKIEELERVKQYLQGTEREVIVSYIFDLSGILSQYEETYTICSSIIRNEGDSTGSKEEKGER